MNLCLDIGNSKIRTGIFSDSRLVAEDVCYYDKSSDVKSIRKFLEKTIGRHHIERAGLISVAPPLTVKVKKILKEMADIQPKVITYSDFKITNIRYRNPEKLGMDRLINAYAAFSIYGGPVLTVDIGTAVTWDAVNARGEFLGGAIAPGPGTMAGALHKNTAALPFIKLKKKPQPLGRDTEGCIQSGLYWGTVGMIKELIGRISQDIKAKPKVLFTGGLGPFFAREFRGCLVDELLTLKGIDLFLEEDDMNAKNTTANGPAGL